MTAKIAIIGFGKMGQAIVNRWLKKKLDLEIEVFDPIVSDEVAKFIGENGIRLNPKPKKPLHDIVLLSVKPQTFGQIEGQVSKMIGTDTILLSIMAGKTLENLEEATKAIKICRAMPNTPSQIGEGMTAYIGNNSIDSKDEALVKSLLTPLGKTAKLASEKLMDAVTAVSGSGPAYLYLLTESIASAAYSEGMEHEMAEEFARQTIIGAAALLKASDLPPMELRKEVTSPGGTTEAALDVLTGGNAMGALMKRAIEAAIKRSRELGKSS